MLPPLYQRKIMIMATFEVVIVTGGAGGIGGAIVQRFLSDGAKVAILDMNQEAGEAKIRELTEAGLVTEVGDFSSKLLISDICLRES